MINFEEFVFLSIIFSAGWIVGKILKKLPLFVVIILGVIYSVKYFSLASEALIYINFAFIFGFSLGYSLFPVLKNFFEEFFYRLSGIFDFFKKPFLALSRLSLPKMKFTTPENETSSYNERLRRKEEDLNRQQEELRRKQREAEEELRRARKAQDQQKTTHDSIKYPKTLEEAYEVLGTRPGLGLVEYKRIYKQEVMKYHPDRVSTLGERLKKQAEEEMKKINRAWEIIKKNG